MPQHPERVIFVCMYCTIKLEVGKWGRLKAFEIKLLEGLEIGLR
jgi:hypothetical protein